MENLDVVLEKAKHMDADAMEELLKEFKPKVTAISREYFLLGAEFDDILQFGYIALYKAILSYDKTKNDNFSSFASMCIHRGIQTAVKNANRKKNSILNDYQTINIAGGVDLDNHNLIVDKNSMQSEQNFMSHLSTEFATNKIKEILTDKQFKVFNLFLSGYSYAEIAKIQNITTKQVDNLIQIIKRKLIARIDEFV